MGKKKKPALSEKKADIPPDKDNREVLTFKWKHIIFIALLSIAIYANTLSMDFVWDDLTQIKENLKIRSLRNVPSMFTSDVWSGVGQESPYYRPIFTLSTAADYFISGKNPSGYHLTNILLHAAVSVMFYILALKILGNELASVSAVLVFTVHPVHAEAIAWISGRNEPLAALFMFASLYSYILYRDKTKILYLILSVFLFFIALLSKELAVTLPLIILLYEICFREGTLKQKIKLPLFYTAVIMPYLVLRTLSLKYALWSVSDPLLWRIYTLPILIVEYLRLLIFPSNLKVFYDIPLRQSPFELNVILSLILIIMVIAVTIAALKYNKRLFFSLLWIIIALIPALNIIAQIRPALMADRYLYIPSAGFSLAMGIVFLRIHNWKSNKEYRKITMTCGLIIIAGLSIITFQRNYVWGNQHSFLTTMVNNAPNYFGGHNDLGLIYFKEGRYEDAIKKFNDCLKLFPNYGKARVNLGAVYFRQGRLEDAEREFNYALKIKNDYYPAYYSLGVVYSRQGRLEDAINAFKSALKIEPDNADALNSLGSAYIDKNRLDKAVKELTKALFIRPDFTDAQYNLGVAYMYQGNFNEAIESFKSVLAVNPDHADALNNLGAIYLTLGRKDDAAAQFRNALKINPENAMFKKNLDKAAHFK